MRLISLAEKLALQLLFGGDGSGLGRSVELGFTSDDRRTRTPPARPRPPAGEIGQSGDDDSDPPVKPP